MTHEEIKAKAEEILKDNPWFEVLSVDSVNHKPHPYTIGPQHITYASDNYSGMLTDKAIIAMEKDGGHCAHPECRVPYKEHTAETGVFLLLKQDTPKKEAASILFELKQAFLKEGTEDKYWVDGFAFVNSNGQFKILPAEN